jgi:serine/threonine protein kinase
MYLTKRKKNVLMDEYYNPRLTDFGLSVLGQVMEGGLTRTDGEQGTPCWMAPERLDGAVEDEYRTKEGDVYSFGCLGFAVTSHFTRLIDIANSLKL